MKYKLQCIALKTPYLLTPNNDIVAMRDENRVLIETANPNRKYQSQLGLTILEEKDNFGVLSSELRNIFREYVETITMVQNSLQGYYFDLIKTQINLLEKLPSIGFKKGEVQELLKQLTISAVQFWMNVYTLPWKLALGNTLCIKPSSLPFRFGQIDLR